MILPSDRPRFFIRNAPISTPLSLITSDETEISWPNLNGLSVSLPKSGSVPASVVPWPLTWVATPWVLTVGNTIDSPPLVTMRVVGARSMLISASSVSNRLRAMLVGTALAADPVSHANALISSGPAP
jgi:hypothetical protein